jgi:hypothetical protein
MVQPQEEGNTCFHFPAFQTHNLVGPMNSNLSKTQTQQRRQTLS